ncbi:MAG: outer membrane beta-barrel protein [Bacteroidales bacterium]|nr:outer membrane beta-barrel protein [Bacteroidales bacterium]
MKKVFLLIIIIFASLTTGYSQFRFGVRGGVNWNYVLADNIVYDGNTTITLPSKANMGYHFGLISQIELFNLFVQPELLFLSNKNELILKNTSGDNEGYVEQRVFRLDVPVMFGVKIKSFKIQAGPIGTIFLGDKTNLIEIQDFDQEFKSLTFGYQAGIGFDLSRVSLDLKYEGNLSDFGKEVTINNNTFNLDQRSNQIVFSIGLLF